MKTTKGLKNLVLGACMMASGHAFGQASVLGHTGTPGDHVGWNNLQGFPLDIRHDGNQPIEMYTETDERMTISPIRTGQTINAYTNLDLTGFVGVGDFYTNTNIFRHPVARVHAENGGGIPTHARGGIPSHAR